MSAIRRVPRSCASEVHVKCEKRPLKRQWLFVCGVPPIKKAPAHALCALLPLHLRCEAGDVGCECDALRKRALRSKRLLLFDRGDGGLGISQRVHGRHRTGSRAR